MQDLTPVNRSSQLPAKAPEAHAAVLSLARMTRSAPATNVEETLVQALACFASNYGGLFPIEPNSVALWCEIIGDVPYDLVAKAAMDHMRNTKKADPDDAHTIGYWPPRASDLKAVIDAAASRRRNEEHEHKRRLYIEERNRNAEEEFQKRKQGLPAGGK